MTGGAIQHPDLPPKVLYPQLGSKQQEIYNFQKVAGLLADYGFTCIKLADDWEGADFLAYRSDADQTLKVQLKGGLSIQRTYERKDLHIAFKLKDKATNDNVWFLLRHDLLVDLCRTHSTYLTTKSWLNDGVYYTSGPNPKLLAALAPYSLGVA